MSPIVKVLQPSGYLDYTKHYQFRQKFSELIATAPDYILIDLQYATFMDSSGFNDLIFALKSTRASGCHLAFCSVNTQISILFELTSMDRVFEVFANQDAFYDKIGAAITEHYSV